MPSIPCTKSIRCLGPENGFDSPITNYSSEAIDGVDYLGLRWPVRTAPGSYNRNSADFHADSCLGVVTAPTQAQADQLAALYSLLCNDGFPPPDVPPDPDGTIAQTVFLNNAQSCDWNCPDGSKTTFTVQAGYFGASTQDLADGKARQYACEQAARNWLCLGTISASACLGSTYDEILLSSFGTGVAAPIIFSLIAGALPPGVVMSSAYPAFPNGESFYGDPTAIGSYSFTVRATSANGATQDKTFTISVLGITNADSLPDAPVSTDYSTVPGSQLTGDGGTAPYTFSADAAMLPAWITSIDPDGTINGTPGAGDAGMTFYFDVTISDAAGNSCTQEVSVFVAAEECPDCADTSWVTTEFDFPGFTVATTVPAPPGGIGAHFSVYAQSNFNFNAVAYAIGTLTYSGPACNTQFAGTMIKNDAVYATCFLQVQIAGLGPVQIYDLIVNQAFPPPGSIPLATGPFTIPFTLPDTGGATATVTIYVRAAWVNGLFPYEVGIDGTWTNI